MQRHGLTVLAPAADRQFGAVNGEVVAAAGAHASRQISRHPLLSLAVKTQLQIVE